jgi:RND family efflux transporter MFP subunit
MNQFPRFLRPHRVASLFAVTLGACNGVSSPEPPRAQAPMTLGPGSILQTFTVQNDASIQCEPLSTMGVGPRIRVEAALMTAPQAMAQVGVPWGGRVVSVEVGVGHTVHAGQPLLRIDSPQLQQTVQKFAAGTGQHRLAVRALDEEQQKCREGCADSAILAQRTAEADALYIALKDAESQLYHMGLDAAQVAVLRAGGSLEPLHSVLRAPVTGQVEAVDVVMGQMVQGSESLMRILASGATWAVLHLPDHQTAKLKLGMPVTVHTCDDPNTAILGSVSAMGMPTEDSNGTSAVHVALGAYNATFDEAARGQASLALHAEEGGAWLPHEAIHTYAGGATVFRCEGAGTYSAVRVAVGADHDGRKPLRDGLSPHASIAVTGTHQLLTQLQQSQAKQNTAP